MKRKLKGVSRATRVLFAKDLVAAHWERSGMDGALTKECYAKNNWKDFLPYIKEHFYA